MAEQMVKLKRVKSRIDWRNLWSGYAEEGGASIDMRFEQHCKGGKPALHGKTHRAT